METQQTKLAFVQDPGEVADRRNLLGLVVLRLHGLGLLREGALHARELLIWVFNTTAHGTNGDLKKSYAELASHPWGLCCSESRVRSAVRILRKHRVLKIEENRFQSDGQGANSYALDWHGIRLLLGMGGRSAVSTEHPPVLTEQGGVSWEQPYKEETPLLTPLLNNSVPARKAAAGPQVVCEDQNSSARPADGLRAELVRTIPELTAAEGIGLEALPPKTLVYGTYAALKLKHIQEPWRLVEWFRCQLGLAQPVMDGTEADLLLCIAAAIQAQQAPERDVRKNRVALFVDTVSRRVWRRSASFIPAARELLDRMIERLGPECLGRIPGVPP